jgi:hypothetical protein
MEDVLCTLTSITKNLEGRNTVQKPIDPVQKRIITLDTLPEDVLYLLMDELESPRVCDYYPLGNHNLAHLRL